jgi:hypothetical protein
MFNKKLSVILFIPLVIGSTWECQYSLKGSTVITDTPVSSPGVICKSRTVNGVINKVPTELFSAYAVEATSHLEAIKELVDSSNTLSSEYLALPRRKISNKEKELIHPSGH